MEYAVKKSKEQAKMFKIRSLKRAVDMLADTDFAIKCGKADQTEGMWLIIFKIMTGD
jgi:DNA polymerase III delta subunit